MRKIGIGLTAALFIAAVAAPALASKPLPDQAPPIENGHKVTICHATSSAATHQFWEAITVDVASSGGLKKVQGHVGHTALFAQEPNNRGRFDVIPSFTYAGQSFQGSGNPGNQSDWDKWAALNPEDAAACLGVTTATLTLTKTVVNDFGTATEDDFQATVNGVDVDWDVPVELAPGNYVADEDAAPGFETYFSDGWSGGCDQSGAITLKAGDVKTCSITNTEQSSS